MTQLLHFSLGLLGGATFHGATYLLPFIVKTIKQAFSAEHKVSSLLAKADKLGLKLVTDVKAEAVNAAAEVKNIP